MKKKKILGIIFLLTIVMCDTTSAMEGTSTQAADTSTNRVLEQLISGAQQGYVVAQFALGEIYCNSQLYEKAVHWWRKAAEQGHDVAQSNLGVMYEKGLGVPHSYEEAFKWYQKAAEQENTVAEYNLGIMYRLGLGINPAYKKAFDLFTRAARKGYGGAQLELGIMYYYGIGLDRSYEQAFKWYKEAAEQGNADAQSNLGLLYCNGEGVNRSYEEAIKWFKKAAEQGNKIAQVNLGRIYFGKGLEGNQSFKDAEIYLRQASEGMAIDPLEAPHAYYSNPNATFLDGKRVWEKTVKRGSVDAQNMLGDIYYDGLGGTQSYEEALKWYQKAIDQDDPRAEYELGLAYEKGRGVNQSFKKAAEWYRKAAEKNYMQAQANLGCLYAKGLGVDSSYEMAVRWYTKAADQGDDKAQLSLGNLYFKKESFQEAERWLRRAAEQENVDAEYHLGYIYASPKYGFKHNISAAYWLIKAAKQNHLKAKTILSLMYSLGRGVLQDKEKAYRVIRKVASTLSICSGQDPSLPRKKIDEFAPIAAELLLLLVENKVILELFENPSVIPVLKDMVFRDTQKVTAVFEVLKKYEEEALKGLSNDQLKIGILYHYGIGGPQDHKKAMEWYIESAQRGNLAAQEILGISYNDDRLILRNNHSTFAENFEEISPELRKEVNKVVPMACSWIHTFHARLGNLYVNGLISRLPGCGDEEVFSWLQASSAKGNMKALYRLGRMYEYGWGTLKNEEVAFECFKKGASAYRHAPAQKALAEMYREGRGGVKPSNHLAVKWYSRAGKQGDAGASAAIKDIADSENYAPALYALGRAHEEGWGIARDEDEALVQYEVSALQGYFKGQYAIAVRQLKGKASLKEELPPLELLTLLSGEDARKNYLRLIERKFDKKERKKLKELQGEGVPEQGYYKAQHKLAELYETGQINSFKRVEDQIEACKEAIRLYEKAGEAVQRGKLVTLEPLGRVRTRLSRFQHFNDQEKFDLDHPGLKEFLKVHRPSEDQKLDSDFENQLAFVFDARKGFDETIGLKIEKTLKRILTFPANSKSAWGLLTMLKTLIKNSDLNRSHKSSESFGKELEDLSQKMGVLDPLWRLIPSSGDVELKPLIVCNWMLYDPRVEIFNSCYRDFEKASYEDSFRGSIEKILTIFDKLHLQRLTGEAENFSEQDLFKTRQHLQQLLTHDNKAEHRFKNRLVKISDIVQEMFEEGKLKRDIDLLTSLKHKLLHWAERGGGSQRDCLTGGEDELGKFYFDYIIDSKGGSASALTKEDWTLEMQVAVWLANLRRELVDELVIERDENRIHAVKNLEKKARLALGLLGDAENYADGLEKTIDSKYLHMTTEKIIQKVMKQYTPERIVDHITYQVNKLKKEDEISKSPFYEKLWRRLQFQYIREEVAPDGEFDHSFFRDEDHVLNYCTQEEFEKHILLKRTLKAESKKNESLQDWKTLKGQAYMKARERMDQDFYDENGKFISKGAKALLKGMNYFEESRD